MITLMNFSPWMLFFSFLFGVLAAFFAHSRGKNPYLWFAVGVLFGMVGVVALFLPSNKRKRVRMEKRAVPPTSEPYIEGPVHCFWYYLDGEQQQRGPMSFHALSLAWEKGEIVPTTFVWHEQLPEWKPLQELIKTTALS